MILPKLYLAGPLFTTAERAFNSALAAACMSEGFEVWLPQDHEPRDKTAKAIFLEDVKGIDWSEMVVANMDGPDPDSGTCWEVGYAYKRKPIFCYRTDFRSASDFLGSPYNLMLSQSADFVANTASASVSDIALVIRNCAGYLFPENRGQTPIYRHADK